MTGRPEGRDPDERIGDLVGQLYGGAAPNERRKLIEHLLAPLSLLSLFAVANGVFAKAWFRRGWQDLSVRIEDLDVVGTSDVVALVDFVQQVSVDTINGLAQVVAASPTMGASAAAALLIAVLVKRMRSPMSTDRKAAES